jgi:hypothetical protein
MVECVVSLEGEGSWDEDLVGQGTYGENDIVYAV